MSVLSLRMRPENVCAVVDYYRSARVLEESGADSAFLVVDDGEPGKVMVTAFWATELGYTEWQDSAMRDRFSAGIAAAAGADLTASNHEYRVVHAC